MRSLVRLGFFLGLLFVAALGAYALIEPTPDHLPAQFRLREGSSLRTTIHQMEKAGVIHTPLAFELLARALGDTQRIQAGNYELTAPVSPYALLRKITSGDQTLDHITLVDGWTFAQVRGALNATPTVTHDTAGLSDREILAKLGINYSSAEGMFFPDTYFYADGTSDVSLLKRSYAEEQSELNTLWRQRASGLPLDTPYEALILASIVEKETGRTEERPLVAGVFVNRLRHGMLLQTDPTVIYGLGAQYDGNLHKIDLLTDGPYNTYTRTGLPPTPIALPGLASLKAAMNPAATDAFYFVSRGNGTSQFSQTLKKHQVAVDKYQKHGKP
jgi:UPF0755 protein